MAVKGKSAPYARRSVWYVVMALAAVFVIGFALVGYQIYHLHNQINGLQANVDSLQQRVNHLNSFVAALIVEVAKLSAGK